jgi:E3 ubiquitin-protein ligase RNF144
VNVSFVLKKKLEKLIRLLQNVFMKMIFCLECINRYIDTNIDNISQFDQNSKIKITYPIPICDKLMERSDIKKIAIKEV